LEEGLLRRKSKPSAFRRLHSIHLTRLKGREMTDDEYLRRLEQLNEQYERETLREERSRETGKSEPKSGENGSIH
jgi:hypothetical protein